MQLQHDPATRTSARSPDGPQTKTGQGLRQSTDTQSILKVQFPGSYNNIEPLIILFLDPSSSKCVKDKNKDQQGKGNVHRIQSATHQSRAPRRHQTKLRS
jgi:hypothetical protein